jgi:hypothetical protein
MLQHAYLMAAATTSTLEFIGTTYCASEFRNSLLRLPPLFALTTATTSSISTHLMFKPAREISIIAEARSLAGISYTFAVWREVEMEMSLPMRGNPLGRT